MLSTKSTVTPERRVFHAVDPAWNDVGQVVFTYFQDRETEETAIVAGLYLYLINVFPEYKTGIVKCFTGAAIEDSADQKWDPATKTVIGWADQELDDLMAMEEDFDLTIIEDPDGILKRKLAEPIGIDIMSQDSISTFQSVKKTRPSSARAQAYAPGFKP
jgi:hypothetical protein